MPPKTKPLRVLVIDDEPANREVVMDLLRDRGISQLASADDLSAREVVAGFQPDVVLVDIAMPHEDGTQIAAWVRKEHPQVRVVIYTAFANMGKIKLLIDAVGAHAFLQKPFDAEDLYQAVVGS